MGSICSRVGHRLNHTEGTSGNLGEHEDDGPGEGALLVDGPDTGYDGWNELQCHLFTTHTRSQHLQDEPGHIPGLMLQAVPQTHS